MSFVVYSYRVFLLDIFSIGLLYSMVGFANVTDGTLYPMPLFWLVVGALEGTYALWDYIISKLPAERTAEKTYILWSILSMCAAVSCFVAFALALSNSYNPEISILTIKTRLATVIGVGAIIYISAMNVIWNIFLGDADREARDDFSA